MTTVYLSRVHYPVTALGPGRRIGIWFQGCRQRCAGCISPDTWKPDVGQTTMATLFASLDPWLAEADGVTISGGEPFDQPVALGKLLRWIRDQSRGDILIYSGYTLEAIQGDVRSLNGLIDALIDGPFRAEDSDELPLRGSDNQGLHLLTGLGEARFAAYLTAAANKPKVLDMMIDPDGTAWFAGIPSRGDWARLETLLRGAGHTVSGPGTPDFA